MRRNLPADRAAALVLTVALAVLVVPTIATVPRWYDDLPRVWTVTALVGLLAALALAVHALVARRTPRWAAVVLVVTVGAALWCHPLVAVPGSGTPLVDPFVWTAVGACVLLSSSRVVVLAAACLLVLGMLVARSIDPGTEGDVTQDVADVLFAVTTLLIVWTLWIAAHEVWDRVRIAEASATATYRTARDNEAVARRLVRIDAFVHDEVLSLLAEVRAGADSAQLQQTATGVLATTARWSVQADDDVDLVTDLLDSVVEHYPLAETDFDVTDDAVPLPADVARAVVEATAEALRNVARHAYPVRSPGPADVLLRHDEAGVTVVVSDEGRGFSEVDRTRASLGITVSIERQLAVVGGRGAVSTSPGGTVVTLSWRSRS